MIAMDNGLSNKRSERPCVSIVIPTYNRADYLAKAVASIFRQTFPDWELIVVDDGSSDSTEALMRRYEAEDARVSYVRQSNAGVSTARNAGIRAARGSFIAFLDDDDQWIPAKLEIQTRLMMQHPDAGMCFAINRIFRSQDLDRLPVESVNGTKATVMTPDTIFYKLLTRGYCISLSTTLFRADLLKALCQVFNPLFRIGEDWDMYLRFCSTNSVLFLSEPLAFSQKDGRKHLAENTLQNHFAGIEILSRLKLTPSSPKFEKMKRAHIAGLQYLIAHEFYWAGNFKEALKMLLRALSQDLRVGSWSSGNSPLNIIRPYFLVGLLGFKCCLKSIGVGPERIEGV